MTDVPVGSEGDKGVPVQSKGSGDVGSSPGDEAALELISKRPTPRGGILPEVRMPTPPPVGLASAGERGDGGDGPSPAEQAEELLPSRGQLVPAPPTPKDNAMETNLARFRRA
eukprot:2435794-Lingulodinium_polyedra.AAC.1